MRLITYLAIGGAILIFSVIAASQLVMEGVAKQCQRQTYFIVDKKKFECMEWPDAPKFVRHPGVT